MATAQAANVPGDPPMLSYHDQNNQLHEVFVAPGRWHEAIELVEGQKWDVLSTFPRWSDQPPVPPRECDTMSYTDGRDGTKKSIFMPQGTMQRATKLFVDEDWAALEQEFEEWNGQEDPSIDRGAILEHERGVERMRLAREKLAATDRGDKEAQ